MDRAREPFTVRGAPGLDPKACRYGAATPAVQQILSEWFAIDWFEPPGAGAEVSALAAFEEHHRRAQAYASDLFVRGLDLRTVRGSWTTFTELCSRVRAPSGWDWKFSALKPLSHRHADAVGWSLDAWARAEGAAFVPSVDATHGMRAEGLFFRVGETVFWNNVGAGLDLSTALPKDHAEAGHFYLSYAVMDMIEGLQWQLAEPTADVFADNPFLPLLRCYAHGLHPFALGRETFVLFAFH